MAVVAGFGAVTGAIGGAVSTVFFRTPSLDKTGMKIIGLAALQGALAQAAGWSLGVYASTDEHNNYQFSSTTAIVQVVSSAAITAGALAVISTTPKEALANFAISSAVSWLVFAWMRN